MLLLFSCIQGVLQHVPRVNTSTVALPRSGKKILIGFLSLSNGRRDVAVFSLLATPHSGLHSSEKFSPLMAVAVKRGHRYFCYLLARYELKDCVRTQTRDRVAISGFIFAQTYKYRRREQQTE